MAILGVTKPKCVDEFVVLVVDLALGIESLSFVGEGEAEVVVKRFSGDKVAGEFGILTE